MGSRGEGETKKKMFLCLKKVICAFFGAPYAEPWVLKKNADEYWGKSRGR